MAKVLVTGGSAAIGQEAVRRLAAGGGRVTFTYRSDPAAADALVREAAADGPVRALQCDLGDPEAVDRLAESLAAEDEPYDAFVHVAGSTHDALAAAVRMDAARQVMQVNFWAAVALCRQLLKPMSRLGGGRIVFVSSVAARRGGRGNGVYSASKAALDAYMRVLVDEYGRRGITANCVSPGFVETPMLAPVLAVGREVLQRRIPAGRLGSPAEIAGVIQYLLSDAAAYINGAEIVVDGGLSAVFGGLRA